MMKNDYIVIIPARGGSKSILNKNLQEFDGIPLIAFAVKKFNDLDLKVIVSSDCDDILKCAKNFGAYVVKRPAHLSEDNSTSESAILHTLKTSKHVNENHNYIIFHQCTSPLISKETRTKMIAFFESNTNETVFSVCEESNPIWEYDIDLKKYINKTDNNMVRAPRQKRFPKYIETGGMYIVNRKKFEENLNRFSEDSKPFLIPKIEAIDIDDPIDLLIAKKLN